jgi:lysozyme family protein
MDRNFARALTLALKSEGGWSDNAKDPGGATMRGVTLATFRRYINPQGTKDDLRHITDAQLAACYRKFYWDAIAGDQLPDGVDYAVFDFAVNSGPGRAARYLQQLVGVSPDGTIGPATIAAVNKQPAGVTIDRLCDARLAFLQRLPTWPDFGRGWASRVASVRKDALLMTSQGQPDPQAAPSASVQPVPAPSQPPAAPPASPTPPAKPIRPAAEDSGLIAGLIAAVGLTAMTLSGAWHHLTDWIWSIFP